LNILDEIVEQKKREVAQLPARLIAAGMSVKSVDGF
jgi:hypothetical protein